MCGVVLFFVRRRLVCLLANGRSATQGPTAALAGTRNEMRCQSAPDPRCRTCLAPFSLHLSSPINPSCVPSLSPALLHPPPPADPVPSAPTQSPLHSAGQASPTHIHLSSLSRPAMLAPPPGPVEPPTDPLVLYSRSLRDYTLRLWMESRRQAEERVRARAHKKHQGAAKASLPTSSRIQATDVESASDMSNEGSA